MARSITKSADQRLQLQEHLRVQYSVSACSSLCLTMSPLHHSRFAAPPNWHGPDESDISPKIWVPVIVIAFAAAAIGVWIYHKRVTRLLVAPKFATAEAPSSERTSN